MVLTTPLQDLLQQLDASAVARDQAGGHAAAEKAALREAGLLRDAIPTAWGGHGLPWFDVLRTIRQIAAVDSALAHILAFHHLQVATLLIFASPAQQQRWLTRSAEEQGWWGNAINPLDARLKAHPAQHGQHSGYTLQGTKGFGSGSTGSSYLTIAAQVVADTGGPPESILLVADTVQPGITVQDDWNAIGQRQTDSVSVRFDGVFVPQADVIRATGFVPTPWTSIRSGLAQLILVNLYAGIAQGALDKARSFVQSAVKPWLYAGVERAVDDPYRLSRFGDMHVQTVAAAVLADRAAHTLDDAWQQQHALTAAARQQLALQVTEAKVLAHRASLFVSQELFEATGAKSTHRDLGLDRYWRNARTHTLHDPLDYKLRALGEWELQGQFPINLYN